MFAFILAGVTDLARTELPLATLTVSNLHISTLQTLTMIAQKYASRCNIPFLGNLRDRSLIHHRCSCATQWTICCNVDPFRFAEVDDVLLREGRVILNLIDRRHDRSVRKQFFKIFHTVVCNPNRLHLARR
jgi:hypothetical protein